MGDEGKLKLRTQRKAVVARHLNTLARHIQEENVGAVEDRLNKLREAFNDLEAKHYEYHDSLDDDGDIQTSDAWFQRVESHYLGAVKDTWLNLA